MLGVPLVGKILLHRNNLAKLCLGQIARLLLETIARLPRLPQLLRQSLLSVGEVHALLVEFVELTLARIIRRQLRRIKVLLHSARRGHWECCLGVAPPVFLCSGRPCARAAVNLLWDLVTGHAAAAAGVGSGSGGGKASGGCATLLELAA